MHRCSTTRSSGPLRLLTMTWPRGSSQSLLWSPAGLWSVQRSTPRSVMWALAPTAPPRMMALTLAGPIMLMTRSRLRSHQRSTPRSVMWALAPTAPSRMMALTLAGPIVLMARSHDMLFRALPVQERPKQTVTMAKNTVRLDTPWRPRLCQLHVPAISVMAGASAATQSCIAGNAVGFSVSGASMDKGQHHPPPTGRARVGADPHLGLGMSGALQEVGMVGQVESIRS